MRQSIRIKRKIISCIKYKIVGSYINKIFLIVLLKCFILCFVNSNKKSSVNLNENLKIIENYNDNFGIDYSNYYTSNNDYYTNTNSNSNIYSMNNAYNDNSNLFPEINKDLSYEINDINNSEILKNDNFLKRPDNLLEDNQRNFEDENSNLLNSGNLKEKNIYEDLNVDDINKLNDFSGDLSNIFKKTSKNKSKKLDDLNTINNNSNSKIASNSNINIRETEKPTNIDSFNNENNSFLKANSTVDKNVINEKHLTLDEIEGKILKIKLRKTLKKSVSDINYLKNKFILKEIPDKTNELNLIFKKEKIKSRKVKTRQISDWIVIKNKNSTQFSGIYDPQEDSKMLVNSTKPNNKLNSTKKYLNNFSTLPKNIESIFSLGSGSIDSNKFTWLMKNVKVSSQKAKELFFIVDQNKDYFIDSNEWNNFYNNFIDDYVKNCNEFKNMTFTKSSLLNCFSKIPNMTEIIDSIGDKPDEKLFEVIDDNELGYGNFYDYFQIRKHSLAYNVILKKDKEINYNNYPIAVRIAEKRTKNYFSQGILSRIYNKTSKYFYNPMISLKVEKSRIRLHNKGLINIDFATFIQLNKFLNFMIDSSSIEGFLDIKKLGLYSSQQSLFKQMNIFDDAYQKNYLLFNYLIKGSKINNLVTFKKVNNFTFADYNPTVFSLSKDPFAFSKSGTTKKEYISFEHLYLIHKIIKELRIKFPEFESKVIKNRLMMNSRSIDTVNQINQNIFIGNFTENNLTDPFLLTKENFKEFISTNEYMSKINELIQKNSLDFDVLHNIIDIDEDSYIRIYELLLLEKASSLFDVFDLEDDGKIKLAKVKILKEKLFLNFTKSNIFHIEFKDENFIDMITSKYLLLAQMDLKTFLYLYFDTFKDLSKYFTLEKISEKLNKCGIEFENEQKNKFMEKLKINDNMFVNYNLAVQFSILKDLKFEIWDTKNIPTILVKSMEFLKENNATIPNNPYNVMSYINDEEMSGLDKDRRKNNS